MTAHFQPNFQTSTAVSRSTSAPEDAAALQRIAVKGRWARNQTIFNDGDEAEHAYKVISGVVRLCKHTADGRRQVAAFRLPGEYFGFMEAGDYSFTAFHRIRPERPHGIDPHVRVRVASQLQQYRHGPAFQRIAR